MSTSIRSRRGDGLIRRGLESWDGVGSYTPRLRELMVFERYTEAARRTIFFARYEAAQFGSDSIDTEHLLLGLIRTNSGPVAGLFRENDVSMNDVRVAIEKSIPQREEGSTSVDIPLSATARAVLGHAAQEAEEMRHEQIECEHLLLGLLWERESLAAEILTGKGLKVARVRDEVRRAHSREIESASPKHRYARIGDIVHYHTKGERGLVTSAAIVTSVLDAGEGRVTLTVFPAGGGPAFVQDARPGLFSQRPEDGRWTWPPPE